MNRPWGSRHRDDLRRASCLTSVTPAAPIAARRSESASRTPCDDAVARIMTTPLQVTMMTALVSRLGAYRGSWLATPSRRLFPPVVGREVDKGEPVGSILERYSRQVLEIPSACRAHSSHTGEQRDGAAFVARRVARSGERSPGARRWREE